MIATNLNMLSKLMMQDYNLSLKTLNMEQLLNKATCC